MPSPSRAPCRALGGKKGSQRQKGSTGGSPWVLVRMPRELRTTGLGPVPTRAGSPSGRRLFVGAGVAPQLPSPQPTPSWGQAGQCHTFGRAVAARGVQGGGSMHRQGPGPFPAPGLLVISLCRHCCCTGRVGFQPDSGSHPLSQGEMGGFWCPVPISPSPPVVGAQPQGAAAKSAGEGPGRAAHALEAAGFAGAAALGALWAVPCHATGNSDCPMSLPAQGQTDGQRSPSHAGSHL